MIGPAGVAKSMSPDESTPEQRTARLFALMDKDQDDRISLEDFVLGVRNDPEVMRLFQTTGFGDCQQHNGKDVPPPQQHELHHAEIDNRTPSR